MDANGKDINRISGDADQDSDPAWSLDGKWIIFTSDKAGSSGIYRMTPDGKTRIQLTQNADSEASWSPDGKHIVFTSYRDGNGQIYVMNADGSNQIRLTNGTDNYGQPAWSPDGKKIAFTTNNGNNTIYNDSICTMNADGTDCWRSRSVTAFNLTLMSEYIA